MSKRNKHQGFWTSVDGEPVHILGDPNMSEETLAALQAVVRAVVQRMDPTKNSRAKIEAFMKELDEGNPDV